MTLTHNVLWQASLSNGETLYEGLGLFEEIEGDLSPWNKLLKYVDDNQLVITSLSLFTRDGRTFNLPSLGKNPKFKAFDVLQKPTKLVLERKFGMDFDDKKISDNFTSIVAEYAITTMNIRLSIWVSEDNNSNSWSLVEFSND